MTQVASTDGAGRRRMDACGRGNAGRCFFEDHAVIACEAAIRRDHGLLTAGHHGNEKSVP